METAPRHLFLDQGLSKISYSNCAMPIGHNQTISQPYIVARMTELLLADGVPDKVLEIGTGSGYQTMILTVLIPRVFTIERIKALHNKARQRLRQLGVQNAHFRCGDGNKGWQQFAPFDAIIVTAAAEQVPEMLIEQLSIGGKIVIPIGDTDMQYLTVMHRAKYGLKEQRLEAVKFVPFV